MPGLRSWSYLISDVPAPLPQQDKLLLRLQAIF
jgi:hypothetical protein